jgi:protoporphyrinogen oxidase
MLDLARTNSKRLDEEQDVKNKGVTIRYNTSVDDIITSQKQYKIVYSNQLEDVFDGILVSHLYFSHLVLMLQ